MAPTPLRIAVLFATEGGSTRDIAEFIAEELTARGGEVKLSEIEYAPELSNFDAVVIGSAIHNMNMLPEAESYLRAHRRSLRSTSLWLFSVGLGPALRGPIGRRMGRIVPPKIATLRDMVAPREYRSFAGVYHESGVSMSARLMYRLLGGGRYGDLRDWEAIRAWAVRIAVALDLPTERAGSATGGQDT